MNPVTKVSEIIVHYTPVSDWSLQPLITNSRDAYEAIVCHFDPDTLYLQEQFVVVYLNQSNRVIAAYRHSVGGITGTVADIRLILGTALKLTATGILVSHNHPSGGLKPSSADLELTRKLAEGGKLLDLKLMDHILVGGEDYYSFADNGNL